MPVEFSSGDVSNMKLVLSITFVIAIYGVVCVRLAHFSLGNWKDISIAHVIIIIKSEVSILPSVIIFFCGCVPEMFVISYSVTYCICIQGKPGFCFHYYCAVYDVFKYVIWLADRIPLFVQNTSSLSSLCKIIWRHWNYEMPVRYILSSVWVKLSVFSQLSIIQCMGLCVFSFPISLVMKIYTLSYYHHPIGSMNYYPLFRVMSWNNSLRCTSLYIITIIEETGEFPHKGQWRWALMFSLIPAWPNNWVDNRNAGDLRSIMTSHCNEWSPAYHSLVPSGLTFSVWIWIPNILRTRSRLHSNDN